MTANLRLLRIETKRSAALFVLPVMVAIAWIYARDTLFGRQILIWEDASILFRGVLALIGPVIGGMAAWVAGRDRRRGMDEILGTMPRSRQAQLLVNWGGVMAWGFGAYALVIASFVVVAYTQTSWGGPYFWPLATGLTVLFAHGAVGFALGWHLPGRFTAPLVAMGLMGVQIMPVFTADSSFLDAQLRSMNLPPNALEYLAPVGGVRRSVFFGLQPDLGLPHVMLFGGIGGTALASMAVRMRRSTLSVGGFVVAVAIAVAGIPMSLQASTDVISVIGQGADGLEVDIRQEMIPYEPVCSDDPLSVCVHPAYESALEEVSAFQNRLAAPLIGIPGFPARAEQVPYEFAAVKNPSRDIPEDVLLFEMDQWIDIWLGHPSHHYQYAMRMVQSDYSPLLSPQDPSVTAARQVVANWLLLEADLPIDPQVASLGAGSAPPQPVEVLQGAQEFAELDPSVRDAWLRENLVDLRAGKIWVEDLPVEVDIPAGTQQETDATGESAQ